MIANTARNVAGGSGGSAFASWRLLTAMSSTAPLDVQALSTTGTAFDPVTGKFTFVGTGTAQVDGYLEDLVRWGVPLLDVYPDFDPDTDILEIGAELAAFPHSTPEGGIFVGVQDSPTVDASLRAAIGGLSQAGAAQDQVWAMGTAGPGQFDNISTSNGVSVLIQFGFNGTDYETHTAVRVVTVGGNRLLGPVYESGVLRGAQLANWRICTGVFHRSTDSLVGTTFEWYLFIRRHRRDQVPFR